MLFSPFEWILDHMIFFKKLRWNFSQILKMLFRWCLSGHFICFRMRHSQGRNFASLFFKIKGKEVWCLLLFAIENQQNRLITSGRKSVLRFRKIAYLVFKPVSEIPDSIPGGDKSFATFFFFFSCDFEWFLLYEKLFKLRKWLNILLTPVCSCFLSKWRPWRQKLCWWANTQTFT